MGTTSSAPAPGRGEVARGWALTALLLAATAALYAWHLRSRPPSGGEQVLVVPFAAAGTWWAGVQHVVVRSRDRNLVISFNLIAIPVFVAVVFLRPSEGLAAVFAGCLAAQFQLRRALHKAFLNAAVLIAAMAVAIAVYDGYPVHEAIWSPSGYAAICAALAAYMFVEYSLVLSAVALLRLRWWLPPLRRFLVTSGYDLGTSVCGAIIGVTLIPGDWWKMPFFFGATAAADVFWRNNVVTKGRSVELKNLYAFVREIASKSGGSAELVDSVVKGARHVMVTQRAALVLPHPAPLDGIALVCSSSGDDNLPVEVKDGFEMGELARQVATSTGMAVKRGTNASVLLRQAHGVHEGLLAPLHPGKPRSGYLMVSERPEGYGALADHDLSTLKALATNVAVSLRRAGLVDRLNEESSARQHEATHDPLTDLANRTVFAESLRQAFEGSEGDHVVALVLLDIDNFKRVNDTLGHQTGDLILAQLGRRLATLSSPGQLVARLGGDEFAMLVERSGEDDGAKRAAEELFCAFSAPVEVEGLTLDIRASVGVAASIAAETDPAGLFRHAEIAMYEAKAKGTGIVAFESSHDRTSVRRLTMAAHLRRSIEEGNIDVHYQPVVELKTGKLTGAEALARWVHDELGPVAPDEFIPIAERAGLVAPLTWVVLDAALRELKTWRVTAPEMTLSVNVSPVSLLWPGLASKVQELLSAAALPPNALHLELTETSVMSELGANALEELASLGVGLSLDDFGTGYSSLSRFRRLPFGEVKIDRSFVIGMDYEDDAIVRSIITLARGMGKLVTAEGVEDEETFLRLADLGCNSAQGFWIAPPLPPRQMESRMRQDHRWPETAQGAPRA